MPFIPYKIKCSLIAAAIVPCLGSIALNGSGVEHDLYRYIIPLLAGATSGFLIGHFWPQGLLWSHYAVMLVE